MGQFMIVLLGALIDSQKNAFSGINLFGEVPEIIHTEGGSKDMQCVLYIS